MKPATVITGLTGARRGAAMHAIHAITGVTTVAAAVALLLGVQAPARAQTLTRAPAGSPADVRFTPITPAPDALLYPRAASVEDTRPRLLREAGAQTAEAQAAAAVARVMVEVDSDNVPADGQSAVKVQLRLLDKDGQPLKGRVFATLEHSGGRVLLSGARTDEAGPRGADADRTVPGIQVPVVDGQAQFTLLAPAEAQDVRLRISAGVEQAAGVIRFVPDLRRLVAAGLLEGVISLRNKVAVQPSARGDGFDEEIRSWSREFEQGRGNVGARAAFFLKGTVRGDVLLTAAYDSDKATRARLLRDIRPDEMYPVYGDASLRSFDARSASRLYLRLDKGRSYLLYGDFVTGDGFSEPIGQGAVASLKQRSLGQYSRTATGVRLHHEDQIAGMPVFGNLFAFRDSLRQVVEELRSQGSGPYGLANNGVLEGSEKIEVVVRDRQQSARIISVRPLVRGVDYSFEPFSGRILLATMLPGQDDQLNPVSLRITYEVDQGGAQFWVVGGDGQWRLTDQFEVGGSLVRDRNPLAPYDLTSANVTWRIAPTTAVVAELAESRSTVNTSLANQSNAPGLAGVAGEVKGRAARVELVHEGERSDARVFAGRSSPTFNNPAAPLAGGRDELFVGGGVKLGSSVRVYGEASRSADRNAGGGERSGAALGARVQASERLTLDASVRRNEETTGTNTTSALTWPYDQTGGLTSSLASGSGGGVLGYGNQALDPATGLPIIRQTGLTAVTSPLPTGTQLDATTVRLGAGLRVSDRFTLGGAVESEVSGEDRRRLSLGADYAIAERTRLYGRYERQRGWVELGGISNRDASAGTWVAGVDSGYIRDTQLFSELRLRDAISGSDLQQASGMRNLWNVSEGLRVTTAAERLRVISGSTAPVTALSAAADYSGAALWRAGGRVEWRRSGDVAGTSADEHFDTWLVQAHLARKLDRDWTLLARQYSLLTDYAARGDVRQHRVQLGVAYRDTDTNRLNLLARIERKDERDASNAAVGELASRAWILSTHAEVHPTRPWWITGRLAAKWQDDRFENGVASSFRATLLAGRVVYDITENWDLGLMAAMQFGQSGARQHALGLEVGYLLRQNLWLSAGVNFSGFAADADLAGYEYTRSGVYLRLRFKFDENLWRGGDPEVNRSLNR